MRMHASSGREIDFDARLVAAGDGKFSGALVARAAWRAAMHGAVREYLEHDDWLMVIVMAFELRSLIVVLDGIDEAAGRREAIGKLVRDYLSVAGLRTVVTSRPDGIDLNDYLSRFVCVDLKPLSTEQQRTAIDKQLNAFPAGERSLLNVDPAPRFIPFTSP